MNYQSFYHSLEAAPVDEFQGGGVEGNALKFGGLQQALDPLAIDGFLLKSPAEVTVEHEFRRRIESLRERNIQLSQEAHHRSAALVELVIQCFGVAQRRGKNRLQYLSLLIAKERAKRVMGFAEAPVHQANHLAEVAPGKRFHGFVG